MDEDTLGHIRTSLVKHTEEWLFNESLRSSGKLLSFLDVFTHEPTDYVLILISLPNFSETTGELEGETYLIDLMSRKDYEKVIEENDGIFAPKSTNLIDINENSVILKILFLIKEVSEEDDKIVQYYEFKKYVKDRYRKEKDGENYKS